MSEPPRTLAELVGEGMDAQYTFAHELYLRVDDGPLSADDQVALGAFLAMVAVTDATRRGIPVRAVDE